MSEYSDTINKQFDEEMMHFKENPPIACDHSTALKLLREFERDSIDFGTKFWPNSVEKYLPAVVEGTMFSGEALFPHAEAMKIARERVQNIAYQEQPRTRRRTSIFRLFSASPGCCSCIYIATTRRNGDFYEASI
ncbi:MAG: hypothetical protein IJW00_00125 [Clostridia bacterium]|nr:hypothetical protein [Clostridia bacterium]